MSNDTTQDVPTQLAQMLAQAGAQPQPLASGWAKPQVAITAGEAGAYDAH